MRLTKLKPSKALNLAFRKVKPQREYIETFKSNLINLLDQIDIKESEEFHKNIISKFLHDTYYDTRFYINTKHRNDLVIHNDKTAKSSVGVIIEAKSPINKSEMLKVDNLNTKAFHELVLYYLRERITHKNLEVKHLVITNINEWFIFDANTFEKLFAQNKGLVKQFDDFENGRLAGRTTDFFYKEIADPFIASITQEIEFTYFDIRDYQKPLRNDDQKDDNKLISLFKLLSPEHLLKLPFTNDSNTLDKRFYSELLHIIGLSESKEGGKKLIGRNKEGQRNSGSILEDAIIQLDSLDKINRLDKPSQYGNTHQERLFNVALELSITWINRILFLKLLEAQLISYHKGDKSYSFLNQDRIKEYDDLNILFFQVLARRFDERNTDVQQLYEKVPYLNSSLFEPTEMEQVTLFISNLKDDKTIPIISTTVLKDKQGRKRTGSLSTLEYLFEFLNAYDFSSEGSEEIQEDNKTLINASVLGLIFEKINGYKDGSFFTPGFITMYMCRETIRKAVVQKFNETKAWNCTDFKELYNKIEDLNEANDIVNSIKICDPAVGSGHFLVSALNEMIAVKNDLNILQDRTGRRLKEYQVEVVNDELIVTDEEGDLFEYNPTNKESQRIQETLFHEKQTIIENCLFGVDINPNSVKICRLRLWIELLKNAYYKNATELETLPNIDINIKCGNSLVSRFAIDSDLSQALKKSKWTIDSYRIAVQTYRNAESKEQKKEMERLIADIKSDFRSEISKNDTKVKRLRKLLGELFQLTNQTQLFEKSKKEKAAWNKKVDILTKETKKLEIEIEEIKANKIFENAFEWRFEFPEVLNDDGDFVGFDVVIGNPPYLRIQDLNHDLIDWYKANKSVAHKRIDISTLFFELAEMILRSKGLSSFISSNQFLVSEYGRKLRAFFLSDLSLDTIVDYGDLPVFDDALTYVSIFNFSKSEQKNFDYYPVTSLIDAKNFRYETKKEIDCSRLSDNSWVLGSDNNLIEKLRENLPLSDLAKCSYGIVSGADDVFIVSDEIIRENNLETQILLPLIRANNCKRYYFANYTLRIIYPYKFDKGSTVLLSESELAELYPNVFKYLFSFKNKLIKRKDSRRTFEGSEKWYSLTRFGQIDIFNKEKIVFPGEQKHSKFSIDRSKSGYSGARVFGVTTVDKELDLKYLLAILNSNVTKFIIHSTFPLKQGGYYSMSSAFIGKLPIAKPSIDNQTKIIQLVDEIIDLKGKGGDTTVLESQVDKIIYKLYNLTEVEIATIEAV
jgi:adenine-specific DNA-methyltransferase